MTNQETAPNHYILLQVRPTASPQEIRRAYRDLSKLYHPDTTTLSAAIATEKFKVLNEAYATLSNPQARLAYDYSIGISKLSVMQAPNYLNRPASERR
ncbi:MAG: J domain-containing protein, partial [Cyanobacteria bacterium P01_E01_bin.43]